MKKIKKISFIIAQAVSIFILLTACNNDNTVVHTYRNISTEGWNKKDTVTINIDSLTSSGNYCFDIEIRNKENYPYKSLWLIVERNFKNPSCIRKDTIECHLFNNSSEDTGKGIFIFQNAYTLPSMKLEKGQYGHIHINHFMIKEYIPGISNIGIRMYGN